jgi:hypothetical protein
VYSCSSTPPPPPPVRGLTRRARALTSTHHLLAAAAAARDEQFRWQAGERAMSSVRCACRRQHHHGCKGGATVGFRGTHVLVCRGRTQGAVAVRSLFYRRAPHRHCRLCTACFGSAWYRKYVTYHSPVQLHRKYVTYHSPVQLHRKYVTYHSPVQLHRKYVTYHSPVQLQFTASMLGRPAEILRIIPSHHC